MLGGCSVFVKLRVGFFFGFVVRRLLLLFLFFLIFVFGPAKAFIPPPLAFFFLLCGKFYCFDRDSLGVCQGGWDSAGNGSCDRFPRIAFMTFVAWVSPRWVRWMNHASVPISSHSVSSSGNRDRDSFDHFPKDWKVRLPLRARIAS